ncbi:MAG: FAD-linked oxidase C-terminal domain-containing protein [Methanocellales archaeon]
MTRDVILEKLIEIVGRDRVTADPAELYCYSYDSSYIVGKAGYAVIPLSTEEIVKIVKLANEYKIPVVPRGAGSGLTGGAVPIKGGIVLDMRRMNRILEIDIENLQVLVEPGVILDDLNAALKKYNFFFPPDPASSDTCTIGGVIANNASGMRSIKYGICRDYVLDLEVVMPDGEVINTGSKALVSSSGYDLTRLFVGSEGTLGIITKARLKILPLPEASTRVVAYFDDIEKAGNAVVKTLSSGILPSAIELMDRSGITAVKKCLPEIKLPDADAMLLFEVDGLKEAVERQAKMVADACLAAGATSVAIPKTKQEGDELWAARKNVGVAVTRLVPEYVRVYDAEDVGAPIKAIPKVLKRMAEISKEYDLPLVNYGHMGVGIIHAGFSIDLLNKEHWKKVERVREAIYEAILEVKGTLTGEHGTGLTRAQYMERAHGKSFEIMKKIKRALDPNNIMNPGKMGM